MNKNELNQNNQNGFSLIETLVAVTVLLLGIFAPLTLVQTSLQAAQVAKSNVTAAYLAEDVFEYLKNVRDSNIDNGDEWDRYFFSRCNGSSGCRVDTTRDFVHPAAFTRCSGSCPRLRQNESNQLVGYNSAWKEMPFRRTVYMDSLSGGNEIRSTIVIEWQQYGKAHTYTLQQNMYDLTAGFVSTP